MSIESPYGTTLDLMERSVETWKSLAPLSYPDYEVSDMGRVRCVKDRQGHKAPFFPAVAYRSQRPVVTLRTAEGRSQSRRVDELVLELFRGPRPSTGNWGATSINGDRLDVRADNLAWTEGTGRKTKSRSKIRRTKRTTKTSVKIPSQIKHGHWLGVGNVLVSIQPTDVIELTVGDQDDHNIPVKDLDDVIRVLQAAKTIIEG